ncbi:hypothetical protein RhiJN_17187 [Ceratobasidium sp. AG-Ba]|nr:hypothetical protein RhiJN_17187 [Ceratobasidium sp. AG-Ba]
MSGAILSPFVATMPTATTQEEHIATYSVLDLLAALSTHNELSRDDPGSTLDEVQTVQFLYRMVLAGVDLSLMINLVEQSPFEIIEPDFEPCTGSQFCPYIVVSYAPDTEASLLAVEHNSRPTQFIQDGSALMIPAFHATRPQSSTTPDYTTITTTLTQNQDPVATLDLTDVNWWSRDGEYMDFQMDNLCNLDLGISTSGHGELGVSSIQTPSVTADPCLLDAADWRIYSDIFAADDFDLVMGDRPIFMLEDGGNELWMNTNQLYEANREMDEDMGEDEMDFEEEEEYEGKSEMEWGEDEDDESMMEDE